MADDVRRHMSRLGVRRLADLVGSIDLLERNKAIRHWKADGLDLKALLVPAAKPRPVSGFGCSMKQDHGLEKRFDRKLIALAGEALESGAPVRSTLALRNTARAVGATLSYEISKRYGLSGLPDDTIHFTFEGSAGQSFGAWLTKGVTLELEGDGNDYIGKGLSGGRIIMYPPRDSTSVPEENILIGNVALYGATSGQAFFRGMAAERFCVRNSGARVVVEGVGEHGCEYMTGGRVVVLGKTGRNFAAGMSGGIAYVWDIDGEFSDRCNTDMVDLEPLELVEEQGEVRILIALHLRYTGSEIARNVLENWDTMLAYFVKVMPRDYRLVLQKLTAQARGA